MKRLPTGDVWLHEPKLDGWRLQAVKRGKDVALYSRHGREFTQRFPVIAEAIAVKPWHWFALKGDDSRPLFAFAGVWRRYKGPIKKDGPSVELEVYSFLTTTPNPLVETINHERMPVLLTTEDDFATWLNGTPTEAMSLARQYPPEGMRIVQEGFTKQDMLEAA